MMRVTLALLAASALLPLSARAGGPCAGGRTMQVDGKTITVLGGRICYDDKDVEDAIAQWTDDMRSAKPDARKELEQLVLKYKEILREAREAVARQPPPEQQGEDRPPEPGDRTLGPGSRSPRAEGSGGGDGSGSPMSLPGESGGASPDSAGPGSAGADLDSAGNAISGAAGAASAFDNSGLLAAAELPAGGHGGRPGAGPGGGPGAFGSPTRMGGLPGDPARPVSGQDLLLAAGTGFQSSLLQQGLKLGVGPDGRPAIVDRAGRLADARRLDALRGQILADPMALMKRPDFFAVLPRERFGGLKGAHRAGEHPRDFKDMGLTAGDRDFEWARSCNKLSGDCNPHTKLAAYKKKEFVPPEDLDRLWKAIKDRAGREEVLDPAVARAREKLGRRRASGDRLSGLVGRFWDRLKSFVGAGGEGENFGGLRTAGGLPAGSRAPARIDGPSRYPWQAVPARPVPDPEFGAQAKAGLSPAAWSRLLFWFCAGVLALLLLGLGLRRAARRRA